MQQVARPVGRRQPTRSPVPRDADFLIISPAGWGIGPVMDIGTYTRAWMILDNYPWAQVYAFHGADLMRVEMSRPRGSSRTYGDNLWWTRDLQFTPFSAGPVA